MSLKTCGVLHTFRDKHFGKGSFFFSQPPNTRFTWFILFFPLRVSKILILKAVEYNLVVNNNESTGKGRLGRKTIIMTTMEEVLKRTEFLLVLTTTSQKAL